MSKARDRLLLKMLAFCAIRLLCGSMLCDLVTRIVVVAMAPSS
jgi:hypothetical protein